MLINGSKKEVPKIKKSFCDVSCIFCVVHCIGIAYPDMLFL